MFTRNHCLRSILGSALVLTLSVAASAAVLEKSPPAVAYDDLNLSAPDGIATLYKRIQRAAFAYCESVTVVTGTRTSSALNRCVKDAVETSVDKADLPALVAFHESRVSTNTGARW